MNDRRLAAALDRCISDVRAGGDLEVVLRRHEELRPELDSHVMTALSLPPATASFDDGAAVRERVLAFAYETPQSQSRKAFAVALPLLRRPTFHLPRFVLAPVLATLVIAVALSFLLLRPAPGMEASTVLTVLAGDVRIETAKGTVVARDGMKLRPGDRVITGEDGRVVLTFADGSTVTVESDAVVRLLHVSADDGRIRVELDQTRGSTWTYIPESIGAADVHIQTPSARVETSESAVQTTVRSGQTEVGAQSGSIAVESQQTRVEVPGGHRSSFEEWGAVASPQPVAAPRRELILRVEGDALAFVTDPKGGTVGTVAPGVPINQISNAWMERTAAATIFHLPEPVGGQYTLSLSATAAPVTVTAQLAQGGSSQQTLSASSAGQSVGIAVGSNDSVSLSAAAPSPPSQTNKVVVPERAAEKAATVAPVISTATPLPTKTVTPTSTTTPRPAPTTTPMPVKTPSVAPAEPVAHEESAPISSDNLRR